MMNKSSKSKRNEVRTAHDRYANEEVQYLPVTRAKREKKPRIKEKGRKGHSPAFDNRMKSANKNAEQVRHLL